MNAKYAKAAEARKNNLPRPLNVGTVFETIGESTLGGRPGSRGIITGKMENGIYEVVMYSGHKGQMFGTIMRAV